MKNLQAFIKLLEKKGQLKRIASPVSTYLEMTEIHKRTLQQNGPALLFENVLDKNRNRCQYPVLVNLFGNRERILLGLNKTEESYAKLGNMLAALRYPKAVGSFKEAIGYLPLLKRVLSMKTKEVSSARSQQKVYTDEKIDLANLPIQWCWPNEPAPLITWGLVTTKSYKSSESTESKMDEDYNMGVYRLQVLDKNKLIVRWLKHRGGAMHFRRWKQKYKGEDMPVAITIGADPTLILASVMPLPENVSEMKFAGLLRGSKTEVVKAKTVDLMVPASGEIIIEGYISATETALEGPYGDHTGYYNAAEPFPVMTVTAITTAKNPVYLSTYTGRPMDEPAVLALALNDLFTPIIKQQFPEIVDLYLLPEACSYRMINVSIRKSYPGQAQKIALGIWSYLNQFMYTKTITVIDADLNPRDYKDVNWAISTNLDPVRDIHIIKNTPMDYLDFASEKEHVASKMIIDATTKIYPETERKWGKKIKMDEDVIETVNKKWNSLKIFQ